MFLKKSVCFLLFLAVSAVAQSAYCQTEVYANNPHLKYMGRIKQDGKMAEMFWSGSSVSINFTGTQIKAVLKDERANNFFDVIIDGDSVYRFKPDSVKKEYTLASNLTPGKHQVQLFKITEFDRGKTTFYGFRLNEGQKVLNAPPVNHRKIEFYGNSITCGYGVLDSTGDSNASIYEDNYQTYAAITARHFNAEYSCIAKSGIGIMISWFPYVMPDIYDRLDPNDPQSKWNFANYSPQIVVINLFQNDSWLVHLPQHESFKRVFGTKAPDEDFIIKSYKDFVQSIRNKYPKAAIICALGNMDATAKKSPWPGYITQAVEKLNDKNIYTHFFPYKNTSGHPDVKEQKAMADDLIKFIDENLKW